MTVLVTGSAGHLGEALVRVLRQAGRPVRGMDIKPSPFTDHVGSIADAAAVKAAMTGITAVIHPATLHKPHVGTHSYADFVETNVSGTLALLEAAIAAGVNAFVFTSTTSAFGEALSPSPDQPAAWITEDVLSVPKNIYGVSKVAAEGLCELFARRHSLPTIILRTSRFFPESDDDEASRKRYSLENAQAVELLYRRADVADVVSAHLLAIERAASIKFGHYIISATTPFSQADLADLRHDASAVLQRYFPDAPSLFAAHGWEMFPSIDRVYVNARARQDLGWEPNYGFDHVLACLRGNRSFRSPLAHMIGSKGYHDTVFDGAPYPLQ